MKESRQPSYPPARAPSSTPTQETPAVAAGDPRDIGGPPHNLTTRHLGGDYDGGAVGVDLGLDTAAPRLEAPIAGEHNVPLPARAGTQIRRIRGALDDVLPELRYDALTTSTARGQPAPCPKPTARGASASPPSAKITGKADTAGGHRGDPVDGSDRLSNKTINNTPGQVADSSPGSSPPRERAARVYADLPRGDGTELRVVRYGSVGNPIIDIGVWRETASVPVRHITIRADEVPAVVAAFQDIAREKREGEA